MASIAPVSEYAIVSVPASKVLQKDIIRLPRYRNWESMLFAQNQEDPILRTNKNMEIFFRRIEHNIRK